MPRRVVGILSLLLVFAFKMRAQGEVVLSIGGEPVKRTEFEYYFRKSHKHTPDSFLSSFINYKLKVHYAHDTGIDTLSAFRRQMAWYRGKLLKNIWWMLRRKSRQSVSYTCEVSNAYR